MEHIKIHEKIQYNAHTKNTWGKIHAEGEQAVLGRARNTCLESEQSQAKQGTGDEGRYDEGERVSRHNAPVPSEDVPKEILHVLVQGAHRCRSADPPGGFSVTSLIASKKLVSVSQTSPFRRQHYMYAIRSGRQCIILQTAWSR